MEAFAKLSLSFNTQEVIQLLLTIRANVADSSAGSYERIY